MFSVRGHLIAGKVAYGAACLAAAGVLAVSGVAHHYVGLTSAIGKGVAIKGSPSVGAMNILVMGLESRTQFDGTELDHHEQVLLHSGRNGSQDTNTLILIHIFAGGKKAVGFSIPRDDLVTYPQAYDGQSEGKIDAAYAYAYYQYVSDHTGKESSTALYQGANQAGQQATIDTVQLVTGQTISHFMEVNLFGFYNLAQAFGGVEVCIKPASAALEAQTAGGLPAGANLSDYDELTDTDNSGFDAVKDGYNKKKGGAQYLHLDPAQSLAFVRSRDTLPGTDLGRTHRQQAVLDYVVYELKHEGMLTDLGKLNTLLSGANKWFITDSTFNLLDFASDMGALSGQNVTFSTLPYTPVNNVPVPGYSGLQDVNEINIPAIQKLVQSTFDPVPSTAHPSAAASASTTPVPAASTVTVDVYNGDPGANGLASQVSQALAGLGYKAGAVANPPAQSQAVESGTQVFYGAGTSANAGKIATQFGTTAKSLPTLPAGHVEVLIGSTVTAVPAGLAAAGTTRPSAGTQALGAQVIGAQAASATPAATPSASASDAGGAGGAVTVTPGAKYGIPCVY